MLRSARSSRATSLEDCFPDDFLKIDPGVCRYLAGEYHHAGFDERLAGNPCFLVHVDNGIEYRVGYLIGDLVRMSFGYRLGRKQKRVTHKFFLRKPNSGALYLAAIRTNSENARLVNCRSLIRSTPS